MAYRLEVLGKRVVIVPDAVKTETDSGLALAPSAQDRPCVGTVEAVGDYVTVLDVGDRVLYASWAGIEYAADGQRWLVLNESDIVGILHTASDGTD